jgi:hypothetical protein
MINFKKILISNLIIILKCQELLVFRIKVKNTQNQMKTVDFVINRQFF